MNYIALLFAVDGGLFIFNLVMFVAMSTRWFWGR